MQILFDHQTFSLQEFGGISRYYAELINGINKTEGNSAHLSLLFSNNAHLTENLIRSRSFLPGISFYKKIQVIYRINQLNTLAQLRNKRYDVFHATYYNPYFIKYLSGRPFVVTFLDMIHEKFVSRYSGLDDGGLITRQKKILADRADRIIAISESTKRDVVELLNVDPAKIEVIYLGSSLKPLETGHTVEQGPVPYLLFVGRRERYKNFDGLLQAIHPVLKKYKLKLVCAGGGPFTNSEQALIQSFAVNELVEQVAINDASLKVLYQQAVAFIFPTLYEGFGIPVLEAFACNCPCIVSKLSSLPEVAGNAALYIDPSLPESIVDAVEKLLHDTQLRITLIERGRKQLDFFSWTQTTTETLRLYKSIV